MDGGIDDVGVGVLFGLENTATSSPVFLCTRSIWRLLRRGAAYYQRPAFARMRTILMRILRQRNRR